MAQNPDFFQRLGPTNALLFLLSSSISDVVAAGFGKCVPVYAPFQFALCCDKHQDQNQLGEERTYRPTAYSLQSITEMSRGRLLEPKLKQRP